MESKLLLKPYALFILIKLEFVFILVLKDILFIPSMRRNLISPFRLVNDGFTFTVSEEIKFFLNSTCVGSAYLQDDMWRLHCSYSVDTCLVEQII